MKIKTKKDQIRERLNEIEELIKWQQRRVENSERKLTIKEDWLFSFWINSTSAFLQFSLNREKSILNQLNDYRELLTDELLKAN